MNRLQLQLNNENKVHHDQIKREKLEELYILLSHWVNMFFGHLFKLTLVMKNEISYDDYLDQIIADGSSNNIDFNKIEMIIDIYARELKPTYDLVLTCREHINDIADSHKNDYKKGKIHGQKYIKIYTDAHLQLDEIVKKLKQEISNSISIA